MGDFDTEIKDVPPGKNAMAIMGKEGDTKTMWDPDNEAEVEVARTQFNMLREKKYEAFYVDGDDPNKKGRRMNEFDKDAKRIIFAPRMAGG
jgi:hypothetical protein